MKSVANIIKKWPKLKTDAERLSFLRSIPEDSDFWFALHLNSENRPTNPYQMAFSPNPLYGSGVVHGVFQKLVYALERQGLKQERMIQAIQAFAGACTQDEWELFYMPILNQTRPALYVPPHLFNRVAPKEFRIRWPGLKPIRPVEPGYRYETAHYVEPLPSDQYPSRELWVIEPVRVYGVNEYEQTVDRPEVQAIFEKILLIDGIAFPLILEVYADPLIVRDIHFPRIDMTLDDRMWFLEDLKQTLGDEVEFTEAIKTTDVDAQFALLWEQGYRGMVIRSDSGDFLVQPTDTTVVEVQDYTERNRDLESIEILIRNGLAPHCQKIIAGLKSPQARQLYEGESTPRWKTVRILNCGTNRFGEFMFPVFDQVEEGQND